MLGAFRRYFAMCCDVDCTKGAKLSYSGLAKAGRPASCTGVEGFWRWQMLPLHINTDGCSWLNGSFNADS